jgi:hypothetical protein
MGREVKKVYRETGRKMIGVVQIHACISCRSQNVRKHERCEEMKKGSKKTRSITKIRTRQDKKRIGNQLLPSAFSPDS